MTPRTDAVDAVARQTAGAGYKGLPEDAVSAIEAAGLVIVAANDGTVIESWDELRMQGQPPESRFYDVTVRSESNRGAAHGTRWDQLVRVARLALGLRVGWAGWTDVTVARRSVTRSTTTTLWEPVTEDELQTAAADIRPTEEQSSD